MKTTHLEERVQEQAGFCPSYLAALESTPRAAELVRDETERILPAPWAITRSGWAVP